MAEIDGAVAGDAYGSRHHERAAYRWAADVTVYIAADHQRRGLGRALYGALFELLGRQGVYEVCAGATLPNDASVGLHELLGFTLVGVYRDIAFKFGEWRSVGGGSPACGHARPASPRGSSARPSASISLVHALAQGLRVARGGSSTVKVGPSTLISPPWRSTIAATIDRPSPDPGRWDPRRRRARSARTDGPARRGPAPALVGDAQPRRRRRRAPARR